MRNGCVRPRHHSTPIAVLSSRGIERSAGRDVETTGLANPGVIALPTAAHIDASAPRNATGIHLRVVIDHNLVAAGDDGSAGGVRCVPAGTKRTTDVYDPGVTTIQNDSSVSISN